MDFREVRPVKDETKFCRGCDADLPIGEFYRNSGSARCKKCLTKQANKYRAANLDRCREYDRKRIRTKDRKEENRGYSRQRAARIRAMLATWDHITGTSG
jgi:recombinational DNA repair protein (RecF pathway)